MLAILLVNGGKCSRIHPWSRPFKWAVHAKPQIIDDLSEDEVVGSLDPEDNSDDDDSDGKYVAIALWWCKVCPSLHEQGN